MSDDTARGLGLGYDGGMAEFVVVPARQLVAIGDLDVMQAAPLTDAGLTPYHAIQSTRHGPRPGSTCVVIGVGVVVSTASVSPSQRPAVSGAIIDVEGCRQGGEPAGTAAVPLDESEGT